MKRLAIGAGLIGGVVVLVRALTPKLHARMLAACQGMFEQMPDDFPPKRMMAGIEEIRTNTARTYALLQELKQADEAASLAGASSKSAKEQETVPV